MLTRLKLLAIISFAFFLVSCRSQGWTLLSPENSPPPSAQGAVVYIDSSSTAILFGGITIDRWLNETWIWNGETWYQVSTVNSPPAREKLAMEYDESRDKVVLFGGSMDKTLFDDTWEWDGIDWKLMNPTHKPPARCCHAMAYDTANKKIIMYGGYDSNQNVFFSDTWEWDGKDWIEVNSDLPEMSGHTMISFPAKNEVISVQTAGYGTWTWNGKAWEKLEIESPPHRSEGRTSYDRNLRWIVFFGGIADGQMLNDTWIFDGQRWLQLSLSSNPPARFGHVLFYDPKRKSVILYGGIGSNNSRFGDTWELKLHNNLSSLAEVPTPSAIP